MVEINAFSLLVLFGMTIIVGYAGQLIFSKTKIPDIIWLLVFGLLVGPVFGLVDRSLMIIVTPFLAALALLMILFDAGLNMNFYSMVRAFSRSTSLAVINLVLCMAGVGFFAVNFLGFDWLTGILLGAIVGGTSSPIVISIVNRLNIRVRFKTFLNLESIFTDPLVIVVSIALLNIIAQNTAYSATHGILSAFSIGAVIGMLAGIVWLIILDKLKGKPFDYMLTLAILFILYVFIETSGGSGAIMALFFGLVLGNGRTFSKMLKFKKKFKISHLLMTFNSEVSFFIRSFFFVFLGLIVTINYTLLVYGIVISAILIVMRVIAAQISTIGMKPTPYEMNMTRHMAPRGLAAAVLAQLPVQYGIAGADVFTDIVFIVIIATVIYTTFGVRFMTGKGKRRKPEDIRTDKIKK